MALDAHAQRGLPAGSFRWYAVLFAPAQQRDALNTLYAIDAEIRDLVDGPIEHEVAHVKLAWWRAEAERLRQGAPAHPLTIALHSLAPATADLGLLQELTTAAEFDLAHQTYATAAELEHYLAASGGSLQRLAAQLIAAPDTDPLALLAFGTALGRATRLVEILQHLPANLHAGRLYLPLDLLDHNDVKPDNVLDPGRRAALAECLESLAQSARQSLISLVATLTPESRQAQRHGLVLAALHSDLLAQLARSGFAAADRLQDLPPLRRLWTAWRTARRS